MLSGCAGRRCAVARRARRDLGSTARDLAAAREPPLRARLALRATAAARRARWLAGLAAAALRALPAARRRAAARRTGRAFATAVTVATAAALAAARGAEAPLSTPRSCSRIAGFSSVETSWVISSPRAMAFSSRRMILPERVFGRLSAKRMSSGFAIGPSCCPTQSRSSLVRAAVSAVGRLPRVTT
jgi:hypothetical protein